MQSRSPTACYHAVGKSQFYFEHKLRRFPRAHGVSHLKTKVSKSTQASRDKLLALALLYELCWEFIAILRRDIRGENLSPVEHDPLLEGQFCNQPQLAQCHMYLLLLSCSIVKRLKFKTVTKTRILRRAGRAVWWLTAVPLQKPYQQLDRCPRSAYSETQYCATILEEQLVLLR